MTKNLIFSINAALHQLKILEFTWTSTAKLQATIIIYIIYIF